MIGDIPAGDRKTANLFYVISMVGERRKRVKINGGKKGEEKESRALKR